jgi:hypothetical protein
LYKSKFRIFRVAKMQYRFTLSKSDKMAWSLAVKTGGTRVDG